MQLSSSGKSKIKVNKTKTTAHRAKLRSLKASGDENVKKLTVNPRKHALERRR